MSGTGPILAGDIAFHAREAAWTIASSIAERCGRDAAPCLGLARGLAGVGLLFGHAALGAALDPANARLRTAAHDVARRLRDALEMGLVQKDACDGDAGVLFALRELEALGAQALPRELAAGRVAAIRRRLLRATEARARDPLYGLPAVMRLVPELRDELGLVLLDQLERATRGLAPGARYAGPALGGGDACGRAHGLAGWLVAAVDLARTDAACGPRASRLASELALYLAALPAAGARLAWCAGDLSTQSALLYADEKGVRSAGRELVHARLRKLAGRSCASDAIEDYALCHGRAGVALLFADAWQATGEPRFRETVVDIANELIAAVAAHAGFAERPGLLDGWSGVALTLLELAGGTSCSWRRLVMPA